MRHPGGGINHQCYSHWCTSHRKIITCTVTITIITITIIITITPHLHMEHNSSLSIPFRYTSSTSNCRSRDSHNLLERRWNTLILPLYTCYLQSFLVFSCYSKQQFVKAKVQMWLGESSTCGRACTSTPCECLFVRMYIHKHVCACTGCVSVYTSCTVDSYLCICPPVFSVADTSML